jgi:hypothetical protein
LRERNTDSWRSTAARTAEAVWSVGDDAERDLSNLDCTASKSVANTVDGVQRPPTRGEQNGGLWRDSVVRKEL